MLYLLVLFCCCRRPHCNKDVCTFNIYMFVLPFSCHY